jgi:2-polyprenyl-3-methyl-5-hydroxy-6-metoxy-1,4-benzoquinol methylase
LTFLGELEEVPCYYCGADEGSIWGEEAGYSALKCAACGLVYVSPRPRQDLIDEAARTGEHATERGSLAVTGRYRRSRVRHHANLLNAMLADFVKEPRWLDVGAGFGELGDAVSRVFPGALVTGLEPNEAKRQAAKRRGLELTDAHLEDLAPASFDVISLMNVWSHLPEPATFLSRVRPLLVEDGLLLIQTGNGGDLASASDYPDALLLPDHLSFAGEHHVVGILERTGFEIRAIRKMRADTAAFAARNAAKRLLGRPARLTVPYRSPFRVINVLASRSAESVSD